MTARPRIVFFGTPDFAVPSLERLMASDVDVVAVYTQPDKHVGRSKELSPSPVKRVALAHGLRVFQPETLMDEAAYEQFVALSPDACVLVAYGKLIPKRFLDAPRFGFINVHPSLLPKWRGPSPVQASILNGDEKTGVSIMLLDDKMDHGPLLSQTEIPVDHTEYYPELYERLSRVGAELLTDTLTRHLMDAITPAEQNHTKATFSEKTNRHAARIDWTRPAVDIERMVRAYAGEPIAWTTWKEKSVNILKAKAHPHQEPLGRSATTGETKTKPGTVLGLDAVILVDTPHGALELIELQPAGKKPMTARAFANGHPDFLGSYFE